MTDHYIVTISAFVPSEVRHDELIDALGDLGLEDVIRDAVQSAINVALGERARGISVNVE